MAFKDNFKTLIHSNYRDSEEYDMDDIIIHNTSIDIKNGKMQYLLFDFEKKVGRGQYEHVYKAIKLVKLKRIPKKDLTLGSFLQMQEGVIEGHYQNQINFIQIFANIIKPKRLGLIFAYGVQGVSSNSIDEARHFADVQMEALERTLTGTFRTLEYIDLTAEDAQWIYQKLGTMSDMRVIRGVPGAKKSQGRIQTTTFFTEQGEDAQEQSEEFLIGMDKYEYLYVLTATSVDMDVISRWKEQNLKEATYWASLKQGQKSMTFGLSMPMVYAANIGASEGWGSNTGENFGENWGTNQSHSVGSNESFSESTSQSSSFSSSSSVSSSEGYNVGENVGQSAGNSYGENIGYNEGVNIGENSSVGSNSSVSSGTSSSEGFSESVNWGSSDGTSHSTGSSHSTSSGSSWGSGGSSGSSWGANGGSSDSSGWNGGVSLGPVNGGVNGSHSTNSGWSTGGSSSSSWSSGGSSGVSDSTSVSNGTSHGTSQGIGMGHSVSNGVSNSVSNGLSQSQGNSFGQSYGNSYGQSNSANVGTSIGASQGNSWGTSTSSGYSQSVSNSVSQGHSVGTSVSDSVGSSQGYSRGQSIGNSISGGKSTGSSSSMGLGPSLSFGKSFAWEDREVAHILDLLTYSANRIITASNGGGMWFTDIYVATDSEAAASAATSLAMTAWHDKNTLTSPLQVYKPSDEEKEYLFKHLMCFSPSTRREGVPGEFESYKYSTLLLAGDLAAYTHPPRANIGGIQAAIDDPPILTIPGDRQDGEIFLGYVADVEKYDKDRGYKSEFKYSLRNDELHHAYISGASRSGKTVAARRLVAEAYAHCRRGEQQKRLRFLIMDPKQDWRALAKVIPSDHFRFYSLSNPLYHPIKMNLMKIPEGVYTERYADKLREIFIRSYGLGDRGFQILGQAIQNVYIKAGCFDPDVQYNQLDKKTGLYPATERSKNITLEDVCEALREEVETSKQRDKAEAVQRILDRMESFSNKYSSVYKIFCNRGPEGMGIDDLLGDDDVIVLESYGMDTKTSAFIFGLITSGVYQYAVSNGGFVNPKDQFETILVIEEANQVLIGEDSDNLGGANPFEVILDQSAGYGLFIWTLTQKIADMPRSVLANSAIKIIGRQDDKDDIERSIVQIGKDGLIADRVFKNWLPDQPTGWFIIKSSRNRDFTKNAPTHVLIEYLDIEPPTDEELENILEMGQLERMSSRILKK